MTYRSGFGFPREIFSDVERMHRLFRRKWVFVGMRADVPQPRHYFQFQLFEERYFLLHGMDGRIRCFVNRCAHQSARLITDSAGKCAAHLICPNHQWAFDLNSGKVRRAAGMPDEFLESDAGRELGLDEIPLREVAGFLFIRLAADPDHADLDLIEALITPYIAPYETGGDAYKAAFHDRDTVEASWLSVMMNNRECNHCAVNHRQLVNILYPESFNGENSQKYDSILSAAQTRWDAAGLLWAEHAFTRSPDCRIARYPLVDGSHSLTFDGTPACRKPIGPHQKAGPDNSTLNIWFNPNSWIHITSDHIATNWVLPVSPEKCTLYTSWILRADAQENTDYTESHLTELWRVTNAEDMVLCKSMSAGTRSAHYKPGPFSEGEKFCTQFCDWYMTYSAVI